MPETSDPDPWDIAPDDSDGGDYDKALDAHDRQTAAAQPTIGKD